MSIILARVLGPEGKGQLTLAQLITTVGIIVVSFGLPAAAQYLSARQRLSARPVLATAAVISAIAFVLGTLVIYALPDAVLGRAGIDSDLHAVWGFGVLVPALIWSFGAAYANGQGRIRATSTVNVLTLAGQFIACLLLAAFGLLTPITAIAAWALSVTASAVVGCFIVLSSPTGPHPISRIRGFLKEGIDYGLASWIAGGLSILVLRVDMLMLAGMSGAGSVGVYSVAVTFAELLSYVPNAISAVLVPKIAADRSGAEELIARVTRILFPTVLFMGVLVASGATFVIPVFYGNAFRQAIPALWLLVPGLSVSAGSASVWPFFAGIGRPREAVIANSANLAANVCLNLLLIPRFGVLGASISSTVSYGLATAVLIGRFSSQYHVPLRDLLRPRKSDFAALWKTTLESLASKSAFGPAEENV